MIPKLLREFDRVQPQEQCNYETYIPLKFDHHRLFEYLIQIHTQLSHKYGNDRYLFKSKLLKPDHIFRLTEKFDSNEIVCWRYYHESIGYNEKSFKPDISIPYVPYVPQMPHVPHVSPYIPSQLSPPANSKSDRKARQKASKQAATAVARELTPLLTGNTTNAVSRTTFTHPLSKKIAIAGTCTLLLVVLVLSLHSRYAMLFY
ncbi:hypothetical protein WICPIJ_005460 [Wickerhamomyces pijperi]|uniref:Uncharacterized protein n=1 Tax=Wickerhamomyces pijperi TaxID=599730 RepID=A0A9P8Q672_WICPI|nr:hypothetical protein WICPIJ_005460 [Wickerhamomyces pijperi]